jgi:hypothetical protein
MLAYDHVALWRKLVINAGGSRVALLVLYIQGAPKVCFRSFVIVISFKSLLLTD